MEEVLSSRNKELKELRALAKEIIGQRGDVEQFFLEALEQIKIEIKRKVAEEKKIARFNYQAASE